jgi:hypothetical protein
MTKSGFNSDISTEQAGPFLQVSDSKSESSGKSLYNIESDTTLHVNDSIYVTLPQKPLDPFQRIWTCMITKWEIKQSGMLQYGFFMREQFKSMLPMVTAYPAVTYTTKRQIRLCNMKHRIIDTSTPIR